MGSDARARAFRRTLVGAVTTRNGAAAPRRPPCADSAAHGAQERTPPRMRRDRGGVLSCAAASGRAWRLFQCRSRSRSSTVRLPLRSSVRSRSFRFSPAFASFRTAAMTTPHGCRQGRARNAQGARLRCILRGGGDSDCVCGASRPSDQNPTSFSGAHRAGRRGAGANKVRPPHGRRGLIMMATTIMDRKGALSAANGRQRRSTDSSPWGRP